MSAPPNWNWLIREIVRVGFEGRAEGLAYRLKAHWYTVHRWISGLGPPAPRFARELEKVARELGIDPQGKVSAHDGEHGTRAKPDASPPTPPQAQIPRPKG